MKKVRQGRFYVFLISGKYPHGREIINLTGDLSKYTLARLVLYSLSKKKLEKHLNKHYESWESHGCIEKSDLPSWYKLKNLI